MTDRTVTLEADLAVSPDVANANTVVALPPSDISPAPFLMVVYISGQPILRGFDPATEVVPVPPPVAPTVSASQTVGTYASVASRSFVIPATAAVGDIAYAHVVYEGTLTAPAGWTLVRSDDAALMNTRSRIYRKTAALVSGDLGSSHVFTLAVAGSLGGQVVCVTGVNLGTPEDAAATGMASANAGGDTSLDAPSITTTGLNRLLLAFGAALSGAPPAWATPTGMTMLGQVGFGPTYNQSAGFRQTLAATGATGTRTLAHNAGFATQMTAQLVAVRPA